MLAAGASKSYGLHHPSTEDCDMSIVVRFKPANLTRQKYDEVVRRLEQAAQWPSPPGLELHVLFGSEGELRVSEIWDSQESLQASMEKVSPIMDEIGIELTSEPEIFEVHNLVKR
jgi:quinol monooxygenase YgiN